MKKNMGTIDRVVRVVVALVVGYLILSGSITGALAIILGVLAVVFLATSAMGSCPLYIPLKLDTRGK
ncbi:MAG TPA: DUF2892 domain-containing protein [Thermoflexales bacterium]|nr:DUF2892 domain-containing protein [Thermoflexales bacterium]HQZ98990.1 DUF2892 domain-containing protein [Thermoflexales bacterium]